MRESSKEEFKTEIQKNVEDVFEEKLPNKMPLENTTMKKPTPTASHTTDREDKSYQYKVRMSGLTV